MDLPTRVTESPYSKATLIFGLYAALAALALAIGLLRGDGNLYFAAGPQPTWKFATSPLIGVAFGLVIVTLSRFCVHRFRWARRLHRDFRGLLGSLHARDILVLAAASAIGEELLFRGALLPWVGIVPSTLIFALLHIGPGMRFLAWTFSALIAGYLFGVLFLWAGDLGAPIAAHFTINFLNLRYIVKVDLPA